MWKSWLAVYTVVFLHCSLLRSSIAKDGLLPNGNFEEAPPPWGVVGSVIVDQNMLPKWKIGGLVEYISSGDQDNGMFLVVPDGGHGVRLGNNGMISQLIRGLKKGSFYSLSFSVARTCGKSEKLNVSVMPYSQVLPMNTVYDSNGWDAYAWGFKAVAAAQEVVLQNPDQDYDNPGCGPLIDGVAIKEMIPSKSKTLKGDLVTNGNFEDGPHDFLNGTNGILLSPSVLDHSPLPGWTIESYKPSKYRDSPHFSVPEGRGAVELLAGLESSLSQTVETAPGRSYRLTFAVGDGKNACKGSMTVNATAGDKIFRVPYESKGTGGFKIAEFTFTARLPSTRISFMSLSYMKSDDSGSLCGPVMDQVQLIAL